MEKQPEALNREVDTATRPMVMVCREIAAVYSLLEGDRRLSEELP